ncbi:hypothetical protein ACVIRO_004122 [Rhizobium ruizarguesonis]|jgi:hypothetical protein|nr:hypothetical protein HB771_27350 [Rhizobium leguminosarum bv. viciae]
MTGRLGFLAGVRRRASRLADLEQAASADTLPLSGKGDPTEMISKANSRLISTGLVPIPHNPAMRAVAIRSGFQAANLRNRVLIRSR